MIVLAALSTGTIAAIALVVVLDLFAIFFGLSVVRSRRAARAGRPTGAHHRQAEEDGEQVEHHDERDRGDRSGREGGEHDHSSKNTPWAHGHTQL